MKKQNSLPNDNIAKPLSLKKMEGGVKAPPSTPSRYATGSSCQNDLST